MIDGAQRLPSVVGLARHEGDIFIRRQRDISQLFNRFVRYKRQINRQNDRVFRRAIGQRGVNAAECAALLTDVENVRNAFGKLLDTFFLSLIENDYNAVFTNGLQRFNGTI